MLRLSSLASARVIGPSGRSIIARHQRQSLKFQNQQQRFTSSKKSTDSAGGGTKETKPPVLPGGTTPRAPAKPPPAVATPPTPSKTSASAASSSTSPTQVPLTPPAPPPSAQASGGPSSPATAPPKPPPKAVTPPRAPAPPAASSLSSPATAASPKPGTGASPASKVSSISSPTTSSPTTVSPTPPPETQTPPPAQNPKLPPAPSKTAATSAPPPKTSAPPPTPAPKVSPPPPPTTVPPPPPPPSVSSPAAPQKPPKKKRRFRNFVVGLTLLTVLSFGGGVFYSLKSDNFRDFFTEYVRFGEEAVTYFEDREFRRRFPNALSRAPLKPIDPGKAVIPRASGTMEKRATDVGKPGPHISARGSGGQERAQAPESSAMAKPESPKPESQDTQIVKAAKKEGKPKQNLSEIPLLELKDVDDPVVQNLAMVVNSIIALANQSGSAEVFDSAISSAKSELSRLSNQIANIKQNLKKNAEEQLKQKDLEFTTVAQGLLQNVDNEIANIEHRWKDEFEAEREKMANSYRAKLQTELQRSSQVAEHRLRNELLEQAIEMKRKWIGEIEDRVEQERNGRLGKLKELSDTVDELTELSTAWAGVIDANLKTQQIHVAVGAVRAALESPEQPKPFLRELAALKEIGDDDEVVRAAIASINPLAYQKGVPTAAQLVDRFRRVSDEVRKASLLPENAGIAGHAASWVLSKVLFKKKGLAQGDDVESILTRTETYLEEGDIDNAAREMNQLKGWAKILARDWLKEARLLLEVQQAIDVIVAEARLQSLRVQGG